MRVVDVCEFYAERGGGVKSYANAKLRAGARAGHEVVVVAPGPRDAEERREGGRIVWLKSPPMPFDPRYHVLLRERRQRARVIVGIFRYREGRCRRPCRRCF